MSSLAERKARLIVHGDAPYNAEPPLARLRAAYRTAADDFYVRSHGDLPEIDAEGCLLTVDGAITTALELSLQGLRSGFPQVTVTATMQCAGNRRADMRAVAPVSGDPWDGGAVQMRRSVTAAKLATAESRSAMPSRTIIGAPIL